MKKYLWAVISSVIIIPALAFSWHNIQKIWAAPQKIETIEEAVKEQTTIQAQLTEITAYQQKQIELQDAEVKHQKEINTLQIESLKELVKEIKKK